MSKREKPIPGDFWFIQPSAFILFFWLFSGGGSGIF
jgi:hypothetical protein